MTRGQTGEIMFLKEAIGIGVAGNFAGHLEQAGEAKDFASVPQKDVSAPKGIFPFYVPGGGDHLLNTYPYSSERITYVCDEACLQVEPEVALYCELVYEGCEVVDVLPQQFCAFNDCSIRGPGSEKLSGKKNWDIGAKGIATEAIDIDHFEPGGVLDYYRLCSYIERGGDLIAYGADTAVKDYMYFYKQLIDWLIIQLNSQEDSGPLEEIKPWLEKSGYTNKMLLSVGATKYTDFGAKNFLRPHDVTHVALYDARLYNNELLENILRNKRYVGSGLSIVTQKVIENH